VDEFLGLLGLAATGESRLDPSESEALAETRRQTRIGELQARIGIYTLYVTEAALVVTILVGLFAPELKNLLMSPFSPPVPEQKSK